MCLGSVNPGRDRVSGVVDATHVFFPLRSRFHPMKWRREAGFTAVTRQSGMAMGRQPRHVRSRASGHRRLRPVSGQKTMEPGRCPSFRRRQGNHIDAVHGQRTHPRPPILGATIGPVPADPAARRPRQCMPRQFLPWIRDQRTQHLHLFSGEATAAVELYSSTPVCTLRRLRQARSSVG